MASLLILRLVRAEDEASAEFRYAFDCLVAEAELVFSPVEVLTIPDPSAQPPSLPAGFDAALLVGPANVLVRRASLEKMGECLEQEAEVVLPLPLAAARPRPERPLYSLRDFDDVEAEWLAGTPPEPPPTGRAVPLSLWRAGALQQVLDRGEWSGLLAGRSMLELSSGAPAWAGLYHEYTDYYGEVRSDVLPFVPVETKEVLEVGCGRGVSGRFLREQLGCRVTGIELNPEVAREARSNLDAVIEGDVTKLGGAQEIELEGAFDVVLALELFEHLETPEVFLRAARRWVRPGGRIVLSVPNVGHYSVVQDLLAGRWDYLPIGLLCYTHLRFFTRRTLEDWLRRCGFTNFEITAQRTELPEMVGELADALGRDPASEARVDEESLSTKGFFVVVHCP